MASPPEFLLTSTATALALVVPSQLQANINTLRSIHDKAYWKWQPHINVLYPFVDPSQLPAALETLSTLLRTENLKEIEVRFDDVGSFVHRRSATVFLKPSLESEAVLCDFRRVLVKALGCDESAGTYDGVYRPHLTIGQSSLTGGGVERLTGKIKKLKGLEWSCVNIGVLKRKSSGEMEVVGELVLRESKMEQASDIQERLSIEAGWSACYTSEAERDWGKHYEVKSSTSLDATESMEVNISTYNLMAETSTLAFQSRLPLIIEAITTVKAAKTSSFQVLCLQEVSLEMLPSLLSHPLIRDIYPCSTHTPASILPNRCNLVTLASSPFLFYEMQFAQRHKSAIIIKPYGSQIGVVNVHLTCGLTEASIAAKKQQMVALTSFLTYSESVFKKHIIMAGDFNLTTSPKSIEMALSKGIINKKSALMLQEIIDTETWEDAFVRYSIGSSRVASEGELSDGEDGVTFDRIGNHLATTSKLSIDDRPQRYDRILFQRGDGVMVERCERFGFPNQDGRCGSDHYGVSATLRMLGTAPGESCLANVWYMKVLKDSTDLHSFIKPYLPQEADSSERKTAIDHLGQMISCKKVVADIILEPVGSYAMGTYFNDSDVDVLAIGSVNPRIFFEVVLEQLKAQSTRGSRTVDGLKDIHYVNSLVPIIEVVVNQIKIDIQYCQAPELIRKYHSTTPTPNLRSLVFDQTLISELPPSSLRPLNTYRDTVYLQDTIPFTALYRTAHRFLSIFLKRHGLYSAKFGFLGGIHLSLMLSRILKLLAKYESCEALTSASLVRYFFTYYSTFDWAKDNIMDPDHELESNRGLWLPREAASIQVVHTPTARLNVASSCTRYSVETIISEFSLAAQKLATGEWEWCLRAQRESIQNFLKSYGAFIRVTADAWTINELENGWGKTREWFGGIESRITGLMVALARIEGMKGARPWPAAFSSRKDDEGEGRKVDMGDKQMELKRYYLIGISAKDHENSAANSVIVGKILHALRTFERTVKELGTFTENYMYVEVEVVPRKKILDMCLEVDDRDWGKALDTR